MTPQTKIATCCYCNSRTMLKPSARDGHELACGSCGAPLHNLKWLKAPEPAAKPAAKTKPVPFTQIKMSKPKKKKRRKPLWRRGLEEAWDLIEDIID